jgi:hypothetical protein
LRKPASKEREGAIMCARNDARIRTNFVQNCDDGSRGTLHFHKYRRLDLGHHMYLRVGYCTLVPVEGLIVSVLASCI